MINYTQKIETDESAIKPGEEELTSGDEMKDAATRIRTTMNNSQGDGSKVVFNQCVNFLKDTSLSL